MMDWLLSPFTGEDAGPEELPASSEDVDTNSNKDTAKIPVDADKVEVSVSFLKSLLVDPEEIIQEAPNSAEPVSNVTEPSTDAASSVTNISDSEAVSE